MSRSQGTGSPVWWVCPVQRKALFRRSEIGRHETVELTGRTRPYKPNRGSALGLRSTSTSREFRCACGYVGWSNHVDLERKAEG